MALYSSRGACFWGQLVVQFFSEIDDKSKFPLPLTPEALDFFRAINFGKKLNGQRAPELSTPPARSSETHQSIKQHAATQHINAEQAAQRRDGPAAGQTRGKGRGKGRRERREVPGRERTATAKFWPERVKAEPRAIPGQSEGLILGRVIRNHGAGRLEVRLFSGETVSAPVAGRIAFRGNAATKTDREACMCAGDYIVLDGPQAAGKMRVAIAKRVAALYQSANPRLAPPKDFFEGEDADAEGYEFDRSGEEDEDELLAAAGGGAAAAKEEAPVDVDAL